MPTLKVTAIFPFRTGQSDDVAMNTFHFRTTLDDPPAGEIVTAITAVRNFYSAEYGPNPEDTVAQFMSSYIRWTAGFQVFRFVPINDEGIELAEAMLTDGLITPIPDVGDKNEPLEVAACVSYSAVVSSSPPPRRRGRIYVGPLNTRAIDGGGTTTPPAIGGTFRDVLKTAAEALVTESAAGVGSGGSPAPWVVFSRADQEIYDIVGGWVDSEPDTQRRRGVDPLIREDWGAFV